MGLLVEGVWQDKWYDTANSQGKFEREAALLRNWITPDGEVGLSGEAGFKAEPNRYHLYVSLACPWAHRTLIVRSLKGLEDLVSVSVVSPDMLEQGWSFDSDSHSSGDHLLESEYLHQIYTRNKADYTGRVTVPVLWDKQRKRIVSNESSEIIRMFNSAFNRITGNPLDLYPQEMRHEIGELNEFIYPAINNGVYRAGFATSQQAYEEAFDELFSALDRIDERLSRQRYLLGDQITEADLRLFTTLIRFDSVYYGHFKCNLRSLESYQNIAGYVRDLYQQDGIANTVDFFHIKRHYYYSHHMINPTRVVPLGPEIDYNTPHQREAFSKRSA